MSTNKKDPGVLSVNVAEEVKGGDAVGDAPAKTPVLMRYVKWAGKAARKVTEEDIPRLLKEAVVMAELCHTQTGPYTGANAIAHNQIDNEDPLRFFVSSSGEIIVNPVIVNHTKTPVDSIEACTSFPEKPPTVVQRYHAITARFQIITPSKKLSDVIEEEFRGPEAKVFQHEVAHCNGHTMYDDGVTPEHALGEALLTATPEDLTDSK